ncbi:hypothetical protein BAE44_0015262 [Dichanthelium oligosanthes]|uniref:RNA polymerase Rpb5 N-terminal domain-containing protein n=1 Tax=Dichanthelium oligosanthes TaxID=888268 RepID=A0A1E5VF07_9POAL|nr:hypothetical protein BAE44_0015262 [Dichanthelium oligosanthes]
MNQFLLPSQQSALTMDSAESTAATAALAPNGVAAPDPDPAPAVDDDYDDGVPEVAACISSLIDRGGSVESHRLFLARRTALEMLRDRGYIVPEDELARTLPEFRAWWVDKPELERLAFSTTLASDPSSKVKVVFCPPEPVKISVIREITELLVNITKHVLKPKHEVLTAEEKAKLLKEYNVVDSQPSCLKAVAFHDTCCVTVTP